MRASRFTRFKEALSQLLCVLLVDGDADEMLSSWSYRTDSKLIPWIDWLMGKNHCQESYLWEKAHYDVDRYKS